MIEVEKKFILTKNQEQKLVKGAEFLGEKQFTDTYYDDEEYSLTKKDIWLRSRDGKFELKIPKNEVTRRVSDQYDEITDKKEILNHLKADLDDKLGDFLIKKGYKPFCKITTSRKKYKKNGFTIDLDLTDFGYSIAEIELIVDDETKLKGATKSIVQFAEEHGIGTKVQIRGKVPEFLRLNNPPHLQVLVNAGIVE